MAAATLSGINNCITIHLESWNIVRMNSETGDISLVEFIIYGLGLGVLLTAVVGVYVFAINAFGDRTLTTLSVLSTGFSVATSFLLVFFYIRQTQTLRDHSELLQTQSDIMALQYEPRIHVTNEPRFDHDQITVTVENQGPGVAGDPELETELEFEESENYSSPLRGTADLSTVSDDSRFIQAQEVKELTGDAVLSVSGPSGEGHNRHFSRIVANLADDGVSRIRVSLTVIAAGKNETESQDKVLEEEHFYSTLNEGDGFDLETRYACSRPS